MARSVMIGCRFALPPDWLLAERRQNQHHLVDIGQGGKWGGRRRNGAGRSLGLLLVQLLLLLLGCLTLKGNEEKEEKHRFNGQPRLVRKKTRA